MEPIADQRLKDLTLKINADLKSFGLAISVSDRIVKSLTDGFNKMIQTERGKTALLKLVAFRNRLDSRRYKIKEKTPKNPEMKRLADLQRKKFKGR